MKPQFSKYEVNLLFLHLGLLDSVVFEQCEKLVFVVFHCFDGSVILEKKIL